MVNLTRAFVRATTLEPHARSRPVLAAALWHLDVVDVAFWSYFKRSRCLAPCLTQSAEEAAQYRKYKYLSMYVMTVEVG